MSWKVYISKELKTKKYAFLDIIQNYNHIGDVIFKERNTLRKIENPELGILAVKSFKKPNFINQYVYTNIRKSKAYRSFHNANFLLSKGIHTPKPLAFIEEIRNGKLLRSFYFSEYHTYDFTFRELIEKRNSFSDWNEILEAFTEFVFKVHQTDILFKDLSPGNVLIKRTDTTYVFSLIDLNRMTFQTLSINERLQNFIRLSMTDEMIPVIASKYAELSHQNKKELHRFLALKNQQYINNKNRKKLLKSYFKNHL